MKTAKTNTARKANTDTARTARIARATRTTRAMNTASESRVKRTAEAIARMRERTDNGHGISPYVIGERIDAREVGRCTLTALNDAKSFCKFKSGVYTGKDTDGQTRTDSVQARRLTPYVREDGEIDYSVNDNTDGKKWDGASTIRQFMQALERVCDRLYYTISDRGLYEEIVTVKDETNSLTVDKREDSDTYGDYIIRKCVSSKLISTYDSGLKQYAEDVIHNALAKLLEYDGKEYSKEIQKELRKDIENYLYKVVFRDKERGDIAMNDYTEDYISSIAVDVDSVIDNDLGYTFKRILRSLKLTAKEKLIVERLSHGDTRDNICEDLKVSSKTISALKNRLAKAFCEDRSMRYNLTRGKYARTDGISAVVEKMTKTDTDGAENRRPHGKRGNDTLGDILTEISAYADAE
jgi:hypothetical protein